MQRCANLDHHDEEQVVQHGQLPVARGQAPRQATMHSRLSAHEHHVCVQTPVSSEVGKCARQTGREGQLCRKAVATPECHRVWATTRGEPRAGQKSLQVPGHELRLTERSTERHDAV